MTKIFVFISVINQFCASSWLITEINILRCTGSKTSKDICITGFVWIWQFPKYRLSDMFCICFSKSLFHANCYSKSFVLAKWSVKCDWLILSECVIMCFKKPNVQHNHRINFWTQVYLFDIKLNERIMYGKGHRW